MLPPIGQRVRTVCHASAAEIFPVLLVEGGGRRASLKSLRSFEVIPYASVGPFLIRESLNGGLANGGLRYLSTIVHDCLRLLSFRKGPERATKVRNCRQLCEIAESGLKPTFESPHLDLPENHLIFPVLLVEGGRRASLRNLRSFKLILYASVGPFFLGTPRNPDN